MILLSLQVFNKLLSLASTASSQKFQSHMWSQMLVSTFGFLKSISNVSGKDIQPLIKQWVYPFSSSTSDGGSQEDYMCKGREEEEGFGR